MDKGIVVMSGGCLVTLRKKGGGAGPWELMIVVAKDDIGVGVVHLDLPTSAFLSACAAHPYDTIRREGATRGICNPNCMSVSTEDGVSIGLPPDMWKRIAALMEGKPVAARAIDFDGEVN